MYNVCPFLSPSLNIVVKIRRERKWKYFAWKICCFLKLGKNGINRSDFSPSSKLLFWWSSSNHIWCLFFRFWRQTEAKQNNEGMVGSASINDVKPQFRKIRAFPCSNVIGYEWRLLSSFLVDWFLLVADDVLSILVTNQKQNFQESHKAKKIYFELSSHLSLLRPSSDP